jgi:hypothetical protein
MVRSQNATFLGASACWVSDEALAYTGHLLRFSQAFAVFYWELPLSPRGHNLNEQPLNNVSTLPCFST